MHPTYVACMTHSPGLGTDHGLHEALGFERTDAYPTRSGDADDELPGFAVVVAHKPLRS